MLAPIRGLAATVAILVLGTSSESGVPQEAAWLPRYDLRSGAKVSVRLPPVLREISGLAVDSRGWMFAHNDEVAAIYRLDPTNGAILRTITVGYEGMRGDFEGLAVVDDRFFLVTSGATLVEFREPREGEPAQFRAIPTGLERECEIEGLAYDAATASLLLPCKTMYGRERADQLVVYAVPLATLRPDPRPRLALPHSALVAAKLDRTFHPSSIEVHPGSGSLFLLAAQEAELIEVSADGHLLSGARLAPRAHRQAEALTFGPDLDLWIADEGGDGFGTLTRYQLRTEP